LSPPPGPLSLVGEAVYDYEEAEAAAAEEWQADAGNGQSMCRTEFLDSIFESRPTRREPATRHRDVTLAAAADEHLLMGWVAT
jgi:hypothetical protein